MEVLLFSQLAAEESNVWMVLFDLHSRKYEPRKSLDKDQQWALRESRLLGPDKKVSEIREVDVVRFFNLSLSILF